MMTIKEAEKYVKIREEFLVRDTIKLKKFVEQVEQSKGDLELLKTQIASARIDGKKEFDADTYMKGKKK